MPKAFNLVRELLLLYSLHIKKSGFFFNSEVDVAYYYNYNSSSELFPCFYLFSSFLQELYEFKNVLSLVHFRYGMACLHCGGRGHR